MPDPCWMEASLLKESQEDMVGKEEKSLLCTEAICDLETCE